MPTDSNATKTLDDLFRIGIALENRAGDIYHKFSGMFAPVQQIHDFWKGMEADERDHARDLERIRNALTETDLAQAIEPDLWFAAEEIERFLSDNRADSVKDLDEAYMLAHEIEFSEVNAIFRFLANRSVSLDARADFVLSQITQHQDKITSFTRRFGGRNWRSRIPAKLS